MATRVLVFSPTAALRCAFDLPVRLPIARIAACRTAFSHAGFYQPWNGATRPPPPPRSLQPQPNRPRPADEIPKDEGIRADEVQVVRENGSLGDPISLQDALLSFDRERSFLVKVAEPGVDRATVCRIVNKEAFLEQQRAKRKSKPSTGPSAMTPKQIEMNWAIDKNDMTHRLKQTESFLNKGRKVHVLLTRKKGKRSATLDEARSLLNATQQCIKDSGAVEVKPAQGKLLNRMEFVLMKKGYDATRER